MVLAVNPASAPRTSNTGRKNINGSVQVAHVDWLGFTVRPPANGGLQWIADQLERVFGITPEMWQQTRRGWMGYLHRVDLTGLGLLAHGGKAQKGTVHVELSGAGCAHIRDWAAVEQWGKAVGAHITRLDLAHDDFEGETCNRNVVTQWHASGGFMASGRPPAWKIVDGSEGWTFYAGKRENGKLARCYEKGKEQGDPNDPWFRVEVEFRAKDRVIPWSALSRCGAFFSGAYPCLAFLNKSQEKIKTVRKVVTMSYGQMVSWLRTAGGRALNVMLQRHGGDTGAVLAQLVREGSPKSLVGWTAFVPLLEPAGA
jgi:phage replication initiation protein